LLRDTKGQRKTDRRIVALEKRHKYRQSYRVCFHLSPYSQKFKFQDNFVHCSRFAQDLCKTTTTMASMLSLRRWIVSDVICSCSRTRQYSVKPQVTGAELFQKPTNTIMVAKTGGTTIQHFNPLPEVSPSYSAYLNMLTYRTLLGDVHGYVYRVARFDVSCSLIGSGRWLAGKETLMNTVARRTNLRYTGKKEVHHQKFQCCCNRN
jgi:hypothetical protein